MIEGLIPAVLVVAWTVTSIAIIIISVFMGRKK